MKILLAAPQPFYRERGTPIAVRLLAETLCRAGNEVDLLTYHEGEEIFVKGLRILRIPSPPLVKNVPIGFSWKKAVCDLFFSARMAGLLITNRYDVIHAVEEAVFPALFFNLFAGKKLVYDMDSLMADQLMEKWGFLDSVGGALRFFERLAFRRADLVLPVCKRLADQVRLSAPEKDIYVLEDIPLAGGGEEKAESLREIFGISGTLALYVGNLEGYQGIDLLLEGMAAAGKVELDLVIIGGGRGDIEKYRKFAGERSVSDRVHFAGPRPLSSLGTWLSQADILLSPRLKGVNTPMKIYSYLAAGKPVLATAIESHTQVLDDSTALLVKTTAEAVAEGLRTLAADEELRRRLGEAGKRVARERYSLQAYEEKLLGAYKHLMEGVIE